MFANMQLRSKPVMAKKLVVFYLLIGMLTGLVQSGLNTTGFPDVF